MKSWKSFSLFLTAVIVLSLALTANAVRSSMSLRNGPDDHARGHSDSSTGNTQGNHNDNSKDRPNHLNGNNNDNHHGGAGGSSTGNTQGNHNDNSKDRSNHLNGNNNDNHHGGAGGSSTGNTQGNHNDNSKDRSNHLNGNNNDNHHGRDNSYDHGYNHNSNYDAYYTPAVSAGYGSGISCNQGGADYCSQYPVGSICSQETFQYSCACYQDGTCSTLSGTNSCSECQQAGVVSVLDNYSCQAC